MEPLAKREKRSLLDLARDTIQRSLKDGRFELRPAAEQWLGRHAGAFVTLYIGDELRGCIGRIHANGPLFEVVQEMAVAAAGRDPRFLPLRLDEVDSLSIEISVLSELQVVEDYSQIEVGRHGLLISSGVRSGLLLPQVPVEWGWDRDTFLSHTCLKADLPEDFWRFGHPQVEIFTAEIISEADLEAEENPLPTPASEK